jgi:nucleoside-diphosphate-sugar epimerase
LAGTHRSVLVTAGAGFIGSHLVDRLVAKGYKVRVLDNLSTGHLAKLRRHLGGRCFHLIRGDITSPSALKRALKGVDVVFHEAAQSSVPQSIANPLLTNQTNTTGTLMLLEPSARCGVQRLIYGSSSSVYGEQGRRNDMAIGHC